MTANEIQLQLPQVRVFDADVRQLSETRIDAVNRPALGDDPFDNFARAFNALARFRRQRNMLATGSDAGDLLNRQ
jgi:hypothetical protein